jgi:diacylglycerol kinase (ATP)
MVPSSPQMRAAAILGLGCSPKDLKPFQSQKGIDWRIGLPGSREEADVILLFGGDGTIHRHLAQLVRLGLPVLIVPAGSGNDFARAIGFRRVRDSLRAWQDFCTGSRNTKTIDLGVISAFGSSDETRAPHSQRYFCCVAGMGLDAEVARRANQLPRWLRGHGGYAFTLIPTIFRFAPLSVKISKIADSSGVSAQNPESITLSHQPTLLAAFANTSVYGGGMKIAPQAKMDDGLLDICVVGGIDPFKMFCLFPTVYAGRHLKVRGVEYYQAPQVRVETEQPVEVYADGEYVCRTPVEIGVQRNAANLIVPV